MTHKPNKFAQPVASRDDEDLTPTQRRWVICAGVTVLSFLLGGLTYKIMAAGHHLHVGNEIFASVMGAGCVPLLIAAGVVVGWRHRVLGNIAWLAVLTLGLGLIALSVGYYIEPYDQ